MNNKKKALSLSAAFFFTASTLMISSAHADTPAPAAPAAPGANQAAVLRPRVLAMPSIFR